jgi:sulfatase modifying factor 1
MNADTRTVMITIPGGLVALTDRWTQSSWSVEFASYQLGAVSATQALYGPVTGQRPSAPRATICPWQGVP